MQERRPTSLGRRTSAPGAPGNLSGSEKELIPKLICGAIEFRVSPYNYVYVYLCIRSYYTHRIMTFLVLALVNMFFGWSPSRPGRHAKLRHIETDLWTDSGWDRRGPNLRIRWISCWKAMKLHIFLQEWWSNVKYTYDYSDYMTILCCDISYRNMDKYAMKTIQQSGHPNLAAAWRHLSNVSEPKQLLPRPWQLHCTWQTNVNAWYDLCTHRYTHMYIVYCIYV